MNIKLPKIEKHKIEFYSEGLKISGCIYKPISHGKFPVIILCHGFACIKELFMPNYAEFFAQHGYVVLYFDYRGFGESEGERGILIPQNQIIDIKNAIEFILKKDFSNIADLTLFGTSFGGANAIIATAEDIRVKRLIVQTSFANGKRVIEDKMTLHEKQKFHEQCIRVEKKENLNKKQIMMNPEQLFTDQDSKKFFTEMIINYPCAKTKIQFSVLKLITELIPEEYIKKIHIPILIFAAKKDLPCPYTESLALYEAANEPKKMISLDIGHYEIYHDENFKIVTTKMLKWIKKYDKNCTIN